MELFSYLFKSSWRSVLFAIVASVLSGVANVGLLAIINAALTGANSTLPVTVWSFIGFCIFLLASKVASDLILIRLGESTIFRLRMDLVEQILVVPVRKLEEVGPARLMAALTHDIYSIAHIVTFIPSICISLTVVIGCLIYVAWLSWVAFVVTVVFIAVGVVSYRLPTHKAAHYFRLAREEDDSLYKNFRALTEGFKELKLHRERRRSFLKDVVERTAENLRRNNVMGTSIFSGVGSYGQILYLILIGILLFGLPRLTAVDLAVLTGSVLSVLFLRGPMESLVSLLAPFGSATISLRKVKQLGLSLQKASEINPTGLLQEVPKFRSVELKGVTHTYHTEADNQFTLGPIDLSIKAGETVFLAGGNGSGKTTLAKILTGLYPPESGEIRLNGQPVTDENRDDYRQLFSVVFYDFYLFDSLLGLGKSDIDRTATRYLNELQLDQKVKITNGVLSTTELSAGQRKRLALLTAYLEDRPFYIFDEWAADQDPHFREVFYHEILPNLKARGKSLLVISHDDRYYHLADRLIKLGYGNIEYITAAKNAPAAGA